MSSLRANGTNIPNTIVLQGNLADKYDEGVCGATNITPGFLIDYDATSTEEGDTAVGTGDTPGALENQVMKPHATAGGLTGVLVAVEDDFGGHGVPGGTIDDDYVEGDVVRFHKAQKGDKLNMWLLENENVAFGDKLSSNGDGTLRKVTGTDIGLVKAKEAQHYTTANGRIRVEVL